MGKETGRLSPARFHCAVPAGPEIYQPGRRFPQLPQKTSRIEPFSRPHLSQVQMGIVIEASIEITSANFSTLLNPAGSMKPGLYF